mmetsp:Transcript_32354/g.36818  ORF Transcript_32354/g.36818 Transcript_32354/m.36818 type:complete len:96 (+) Transcript_32354:139-426(+)
MGIPSQHLKSPLKAHGDPLAVYYPKDNNNDALNNNLGYSPWSFKKSSFTNGPVMTSILQPNNYGNNAATTSSSITPLKLPLIKTSSMSSFPLKQQ